MKLLDKPWMSHREFEANKDGLNIVFGAVLGFVLAAAENLGVYDYAIVLIGSAGAVITILYISASSHRVLYSLFALAFAVALPPSVRVATGSAAPDKLMPTLLIWAVVAIILEFAPRERPPGE
ncbi:hypothetical protein [Croceibacterium aestuarii]|uniref:hypothetical protein n=1 Tax=Croceibacterium aestuarii TaxID=3064139 RepID=UPI00272DF44B|nr:hypothetical protein [Croceibacterium sp. D39]